MTKKTSIISLAFLILVIVSSTVSGGSGSRSGLERKSAEASSEPFTLLHSFAGATADGKGPTNSLTLGGSALYGTTNSGGAYDYGCVFKINTNGTGFALLHSFPDITNDGKYPVGPLVLSGTTLYGMTTNGGAKGVGIGLQRYKGLGEMNPEQLWQTTMDPIKRTLLKVNVESSSDADDIMSTLMGDKVEPRRNFIQRHALEVKNLDV